MQRTAFLHIGPHKTGTTALQGAFAAARATLLEAGYLYPGPDENHSILLAGAFWQEAEAVGIGQLHGIDDHAAFLRWRNAKRAALAEAIEAAPGHHLILSGEELSRFSEPEARALVNFLIPHFDRIRVIAYARAPVSSTTSLAQQRAQWTGYSLSSLIDTPIAPNVRRCFAPWLAVLGRAAFELRIYGSRGHGFEISSDFGHALNLSSGIVLPAPESAANAAISWPSVIALTHVNVLAPCFVNNHHNPLRAFAVVSAVRLPGAPFIMPRESLEPLADALADDRDCLNDLLGAELIAPEPLPAFSRDQIAMFDPPACEALGARLHEALRDAQNMIALRNLIRARHLRESDKEQAANALAMALALSTDRWSMHFILTEAQEQAHVDLPKGLARQRLMRLIEDPRPDDPPLVIGNPLDRF